MASLRCYVDGHDCDCDIADQCPIDDDTDDELVGEDWIDDAYELKTQRNHNEDDYVHRI